MKTLLTSLLCVTLIGCGADEIKTPAIQSKEANNNDPYLAQYVEHFNGICQQTTAADRCTENLKKLKSIKFADSIGEDSAEKITAGVCWWAKKTRRVEIRRGLFEPGSLQERGLIFHELGHCLLDLGHSNPENIMIMNPYVLPEKTYASSWAKLQNELFQLVLSLFITQDFDLDDNTETPIY